MIEFMGKKLSNLLIASSCIATENTNNILRLAYYDVQGAILKTCADYSRNTVAGKREFAVDSKGFTYASSPFEKEILTIEECISIMKETRPKTTILLIPSVTAASLKVEEWMSSCKKLEAVGADAIQLDFFYLGSLIGEDGLSEKIVYLLSELRNTISVPLMPKLNINLPKDYILPLLVKSNIEYVSLLDSIRSPYVEKIGEKFIINSRLDAETTSCFGNWQLPLTIGYTYTAAKYGLKVCAGGGVTSSDDVKQLLAAGASTVQSATFLTKNPSLAMSLLSR